MIFLKNVFDSSIMFYAHVKCMKRKTCAPYHILLTFTSANSSEPGQTPNILLIFNEIQQPLNSKWILPIDNGGGGILHVY